MKPTTSKTPARRSEVSVSNEVLLGVAFFKSPEPPPKAMLGPLILTDDVEPLAQGGPPITVTVTNTGASAVRNVVLVDTLAQKDTIRPASGSSIGSFMVSGSPSRGACGREDLSSASTRFTCNFGTLGAGKSVSFTVRFSASMQGTLGRVDHVARLQADLGA